jgi:hypothetical protein
MSASCGISIGPHYKHLNDKKKSRNAVPTNAAGLTLLKEMLGFHSHLTREFHPADKMQKVVHAVTVAVGVA